MQCVREKLERHRQILTRQIDEKLMELDTLTRAISSVESELFSVDESLRSEEFYGRNIREQEFLEGYYHGDDE